MYSKLWLDIMAVLSYWTYWTSCQLSLRIPFYHHQSSNGYDYKLKCICYFPFYASFVLLMLHLSTVVICICAQLLSCVWLFATLWTIACQAPLFMQFSRQEYWNGLLFPSPGDLPNSGIEPTYPALADGFFTTQPPGKTWCNLVT